MRQSILDWRQSSSTQASSHPLKDFSIISVDGILLTALGPIVMDLLQIFSMFAWKGLSIYFTS